MNSVEQAAGIVMSDKFAVLISWLICSMPALASDWDDAATQQRKSTPDGKSFSLNARMEEERLRINREKAAKEQKLRIPRDSDELQKQQQQPLEPVAETRQPVAMSSAVNAEDFLSTTPLRGEVQMQPKPIPPGLMPGRRFDPRLLPPEGTEDGWFWIPNWAAGMFHQDFQTTLGPMVRVGFSVLNLSQTTENHVTSPEPSGWQMDKNGGIWDYYHLPILSRHEGNDFIEYKLVTKSKAIEINNSQMVGRDFCQTIRVNKFTGIIQTVYQQIDISKTRPTPLGTRTDFLTYWFDEYGRPGTAINRKPSDIITGESKRVSPYAPVNVWKGKDMRASFRLFLLSHGMANLVPEANANNAAPDSRNQATSPEVPDQMPVQKETKVPSDNAFKLLSEPRSFGKIKLASGV